MSDRDERGKEKSYAATTARYARITWIAIKLENRERKIGLESTGRDINQFLRGNPEYIDLVPRIATFHFFDTITVKIVIDGVEVDIGHQEIITNLSEMFIMPGRGEIRATADLAEKTDAKSISLLADLETVKATHYLIDKSGLFTIKVEPEKGDRVLDVSEITVVNMKKNQQPDTDKLKNVN